MSYMFTPEQMVEIQRLFSDAETRKNTLGDANINYADVYAYIRDSIPLTSRLFDTAVDNSYRWFAGATEVNANVGPFATLIRTYTERQALLRGVNITGQLQIASNEVARNAISDILNSLNPNYGVLPNIGQIADLDAVGVGEILFSGNQTDSAFTNNAAWSGALLFSGLGSDQSWRLLGPSSGSAQLDQVDDLKNLLNAYDATIAALNAIGSSGISEISELTNIDITSGIISGLEFIGAYFFAGTIASPYINMVHWFGPEKLIDALRKITNPNVLQDTTAANFAQRAQDLFYGEHALNSNLQIQRFDSLLNCTQN